MAHNSERVRDLAKQIESLDSDDRLELRLLVEGLQQKVGTADPRAIARDVQRTVREVRSRRRSIPSLSIL